MLLLGGTFDALAQSDAVPQEGTTPQSEAPQGEAPQSEALQNEAPQSAAPQGEAPQGEAPQSAVPQSAVPQSAGPGLAVLPLLSGGETESFFYVDLDDGQVYAVDRLKRDPLAVRRRRLNENLFRVIGRPMDQPARPGEILFAPILNTVSTGRAALFVETSSGYTAFFSEPGRDDSLGQMSNLLGRPFSPLSATDGQFALLMRRVGSGKTEGAYLYHAPTGTALYLDKIDKLDIETSAQPTEDLPQLVGPITAVEIQGASQETRAYLLIDGSNGELHSVNLISRAPTRFSVLKSPLNLLQGLGDETGGPRHFVAAAVQDRGEVTQQIFFLDPTTGDMAILESLDNNPRLQKLAPNLYAGMSQAPSAGGRSFVAIPRNINTGATQGIWLLDTDSGRLFYVDNPASPNAVTVREVRLGQS